jgi:hypothetical protein
MLKKKKREMEKIKLVLNSVVFRRILVIFVVGLLSRSVVNIIFDMNVFREYTNIVSIVYYGFMAVLSGFVCELPSINFNSLRLDVIRDAVKSFSKLSGNKMLLGGGDVNLGDKNKGVDRGSLVFNQDTSSTSKGRTVRHKSAGVRGLYGDNSHSGNNRFGGRISSATKGLYGDNGKQGYNDSVESNKKNLSITKSKGVEVTSVRNGYNGNKHNSEVVKEKSYRDGLKNISSPVQRDNYDHGSLYSRYGDINIGLYESDSNRTSRVGRTPRTPRISGYSTPSTMTPLFNSEEMISNQVNSNTQSNYRQSNVESRKSSNTGSVYTDYSKKTNLSYIKRCSSQKSTIYFRDSDLDV